MLSKTVMYVWCKNMYDCSQDELMYMLRKLLLNIGDLPAQTSHILFNYLVSLNISVKTKASLVL